MQSKICRGCGADNAAGGSVSAMVRGAKRLRARRIDRLGSWPGSAPAVEPGNDLFFLRRLEIQGETKEHAAPLADPACVGSPRAISEFSTPHSRAAMHFKESPAQFQMLDVSLIDPDPAQARQHIDQATLKDLANSIRIKGLIHPLVIQPANVDGRHVLIVGERRWRAAVMAGEKTVPVLIRQCEPDEALEIQVFENIGLGMRASLEPRDMANAIQTIAERFETREAAAEHFGRNASWLNQATAAANLSVKVAALLDSGKISSAGAAVQLEKLVQKNEVKADSLIVQSEQLPEGKSLSRKLVDRALAQEGGRRKKNAEEEAEEESAAQIAAVATLLPWEEAPAEPGRRRVNSGKVERVARILGLTDSDEEEILDRLIDAFLALKGEENSSS
jgi:ParB family chromosome partitioning protein